MALSNAEVFRIKQEMGFNLLENGAEPYIGITAIFNQVIQVYLNSGASTTSATAVTAREAPTPVNLTLADATGIAVFDRVSVDVDDLQESATVRSVTGSVVSVILQKAHTGTYPVSVDSGESIVREILQRIRENKAEMAQTFGTGSLKQVDEVSFYETGGTAFGNVGQQLMFWRDELAAALGTPSLWTQRKMGAQRLAAY